MTGQEETVAKRIDVSDLNIYYGGFLAVQDVTVSTSRGPASPADSSSGSASPAPSPSSPR